jgi:Tfp pilus assembly protein PilF
VAKAISVDVSVQGPDGVAIAAATVSIVSEVGEGFTATGITSDAGLFSLVLPDNKRSYRLKVTAVDFHPFDESIDFKGRRPARGKKVITITIPMTSWSAVDFFNAGVGYLRGKELDRAGVEFRKAVAKDPSLGRAWSILAMIELDAGRHAEALAHSDRALGLDAGDLQALRSRYDALMGLGRVDDADATLTRLFEADPREDTARLLFNAGAEAANSGSSERARLRLGQALQLDPTLWQARTALAELAISEERLEDAVVELDLAIEITPRNFKAWERKIEILRALGRNDAADTAEARVAEMRTRR